MEVFRTWSKLQIAKIFAVNRSTVYGWEIHGLPVRQPARHGRPAKLDFEEVLAWYLNHQEIKGVSDEGLEILEKAIRERKRQHFG
jgi:transposase